MNVRLTGPLEIMIPSTLTVQDDALVEERLKVGLPPKGIGLVAVMFTVAAG